MTLPAVGEASYPTPDEIHAQMLADLRFAYALDGLSVNILKGSDHWYRLKVLANRLAIPIANNKIALAQFSPLTATGQNLTDIAGVFGITRRTPSSAAGYVQCFGLSGAIIPFPAGFRAVAPGGAVYELPAAATVTLSGQTLNATTPTVQLAAIKAGTATNQNAGTKLQWASSAFGSLANSCTVDPGGIDGGANEDDDETLRSRLLARLRSPGIGGNEAQMVAWAEESTAAVEKAYCYGPVRGPGSVDVAVTSVGGDRALSSANLEIVRAHVAGETNGRCDLNVTTVAQQQLDVVVNLVLPLPTNAGGSGSGWRDATPWPSTTDVATLAKITAKSFYTFTVNSTSLDPPTVGAHFAIWHPTEQKFYEYEVQAVSGVSGAYVIDPSGVALPSWIAVGQYITAGAFNLTTYGSDLLVETNKLGPGEKTTNTLILPRGRRVPAPDVSNPSALTEVQLANGLINKHPEISGASFAARYATGGTTTTTSPAVPATTADPPKILTIKNLAFRKGT